MCGICCVVQLHGEKPKSPSPPAIEKRELEGCLDYIRHRGPDSNGVWVSDDGRVGETFMHSFR